MRRWLDGFGGHVVVVGHGICPHVFVLDGWMWVQGVELASVLRQELGVVVLLGLWAPLISLG